MSWPTRRRAVLLAVASVLVLSGCPVPVPPLGYSNTSRDNLPNQVPAFIVKGRTTRENVLLGLGTPDAHSPDGRWFAYHSERHTGGIAFVVVAGGGAGGLGAVGYEERLLMVRFDERGTVADATLEDRICPRGVAFMGAAGGESSRCLKLPDPRRGGPPPDLLVLKRFHVVKADQDTPAIEQLIAAELRHKGLEVTAGSATAPSDVDAVVTYRATWTRGATARIDQVTVVVRAPGSEAVLATATASQQPPSEKTLELIVTEAMASLFAGPDRPFLALLPYQSAAARPAASSPDASTVHVKPVQDARAASRRNVIGERTALGFSIGTIDMSPLPVEVIGQLIRAELAVLGHPDAETGADFVVDARLARFDVRTPSSLNYWDINGIIAVDLGVTDRLGGRQEFRYEAACTDRTDDSPNESVIKGVVLKCLADIGRKVREDPALGRLLSGQ